MSSAWHRNWKNTTVALTPDTPNVLTAAEWLRFIEGERERVRSVCQVSPQDIISAYRREQNVELEYLGREVLEMIQNANDAGGDLSATQRLRFELTTEGLVVANTGNGFSKKGVTSLITSDLSPKSGQRKKYIGSKGLGFRAILNWTQNPIISSGNLQIEFSRSLTDTWLHNLFQSQPEIRNKFSEHVGVSDSDYPIAMLAIPHWFTSPSCAIGKRVEILRSEGFDTVIGMPFFHPESYNRALQQLTALRSEILLFLPNLKEISISSPTIDVVWTKEAKREIKPQQVTLKSNTGEAREWQIHSHEGVCDDSDYDFEVCIAIPNFKIAPTKLYSHLPTNIPFPYPVIAHATLELTRNRNNLVESSNNEQVLGYLADLLVQVAEQFTTPQDPWRGLSILHGQGAIGTDLITFQFQEKVSEAAKSRRLIPTYGNEIVIPPKARLLPTRILRPTPEWLPQAGFESVIAIPPSASQFLEFLGDLDIPEMEAEEFGTLLETASPSLSIDDRAKIILGLSTGDWDLPDPMPRLIIDDQEALVNGKRLFFPPDSAQDVLEGIAFPDWMAFRFVNNDLYSALRRLSPGNVRALTPVRELFGIQEFAYATAVGAIVSSANEAIRDHPESKNQIWKETIPVLFSLFIKAGKTAVRPEPTVLFPSLAGSFHDAKTLYFSENYPKGKITDKLYASFAQEKLISNHAELSINASLRDIELFLEHFGVEEFPRLLQKKISKSAYERYVLDSFKYPLSTNDPYHQVHSKNQELRKSYIANTTSFDEIERILQHSAPEAIVAWIIADTRWENRLEDQDKEAKYKVLFKHGKDEKFADVVIPCHSIYALRTTKWVPTVEGKVVPSRCLAEQRSERLRRLFLTPSLRADHPLLAGRPLNSYYVRRALEIAGVRPSFQDLSVEEIYGKLQELPQLDPTGEIVGTFYNALLRDRDLESLTDLDGLAREKFLQSGKLWGKKDGKGEYFPVSELAYRDRGTLSKLISSTVALIEVGISGVATKIERLFGIKTLSRQNLSITITEVSAYHDSALSEDLDQIKHYLYARFAETDSDAKILRGIRSFRLIPCSKLHVQVNHQGNVVEHTLAELGESILSEEEGQKFGYFICPSNAKLSNQLVADSIASLLAEALDFSISERHAEFVQIMTCDEADRPELLRRWMGDDVVRLLDMATEALGMELTPLEIVPPKPEGKYEPPVEAPPAVPPAVPLAELTSDSTDPKELTKTPDSVTARPGEAIPAPERRKIARRVQRLGHAHKALSVSARLVTDGSKCERIAELFERVIGQDRWPLYVGHITGLDGFGCDIISFANEADLEEFKVTSDRNLIARFIEVKGRSTQNDVVDLTDNEWSRAQEYQERYFLYRIYVNTDQEYEVVILSDPSRDPVSVVHKISPFGKDRTEYWIVGEDNSSEEMRDLSPAPLT